MPRSPFDPPFSGPEALHSALRWDQAVTAWEISTLHQDLDRQRGHIETVIAGENPHVAADWLHAMMDAARRRLDQLPDDGEIATWWEECLVPAWIRARHRVQANSQETVALLLGQILLLDDAPSVADCWIEALNVAELHALEGELARSAAPDGPVPHCQWCLRAVDRVRERLRRLL